MASHYTITKRISVARGGSAKLRTGTPHGRDVIVNAPKRAHKGHFKRVKHS